MLILHMDDAGMSYASDIGIEQVLKEGAARSLSVMVPTPWVAHIVRYIEAHAGTDAASISRSLLSGTTTAGDHWREQPAFLIG